MLAVYVTGHGYGHATRTAEALRALRERAPQLPITVVTTAPPALFEGAVEAPLAVRRTAVDVGLVQRDALQVDEAASLAAWREFTGDWERRVEAEALWLRQAGATLVLGDIPPLAFAAAAAACVPSVALGNFSWDWIYAHLARRDAGFAAAARHARDACAQATLLLRLPFAGDLSAFPRIEDVPLVARRPKLEKREARQRLGLDGRPAILLSFGGAGMPGFRLEAYGGIGVQVLATGLDGASPLPPNVRALSAEALDRAGVLYPDLVGAVDAVVTKPGYGIVSDCIGARTPIVFTERGDFPEYPILVRGMSEYLPVAHASNDAVRSGRIGEALERVLGQRVPEAPRLDGADVVARRLLALAESRTAGLVTGPG